MKATFYVQGPNSARVLASMLEEYAAAEEMDRAARRRRDAEDWSYGQGAPAEPVEETDADQAPEAPAQTSSGPRPASGRRYGQTEGGKARRTKEQMAEDREIEELAEILGVKIEEGAPAAQVLLALREQSAAGEERPAEEPKPEITTNPEDRKEPEAVEGEVVEATLDDVRTALGLVVDKIGMADAIAWLKSECGYEKMSAIPSDKYGEVVAAANKKAAE